MKYDALKTHLWCWLFIIPALISPPPTVWGQSLNVVTSVPLPSLISSLRIDGPLDFCGEAVPLSEEGIRERLEKEILLSLWNRPQVVLWLKRAGRYFPYIEKTLRKNHLPDDLKYVAVVESALRPHVGSRKGAMGFWQFLASTGRKYGLTVNRHTDQRRNIFYSTRAAVRYFKKLYAELGSWTLAAAAYNMGEAGLKTEILSQKTNDYYQLYLPLETQRYLFKIIAVKRIFEHPEMYAFNITPEDVYPPPTFDTVRLVCKSETAIQQVAWAAKTYFKRIKDLNPELRGHFLPKGQHSILVPRGAGKGFAYRFKKSAKTDTGSLTYIVKRGDSLSAIAGRFNVPLPALARWNRLTLKKHIHPGDRLVIHTQR